MIYSLIKGSVFETGVERLFAQGCYQWTDGLKSGENVDQRDQVLVISM